MLFVFIKLFKLQNIIIRANVIFTILYLDKRRLINTIIK